MTNPRDDNATNPGHSVAGSQSSDARPGDASERIHSGHQLEDGILARIREWTDLLPGLRLINVLRLAGSPVAIGLTAISVVLWWIGLWCISFVFGFDLTPLVMGDWVSSVLPSNVFGLLQGVALLSTPFSVLVAKSTSWLWLIATAWTIVIWLVPILYLIRQGARLAAGRGLGDALHVVRYSTQRVVPAIIATVMPALCTLPFLLVVVVAGWVNIHLGSWSVVGVGLGILVSVLLLPAGVLGFGSLFAVPLALSALANERDPDPLDALSRGYEVLFRRPLHLLGYIVVACVMVAVIGNLLVMMVWFTTNLASYCLSGAVPTVGSLPEVMVSNSDPRYTNSAVALAEPNTMRQTLRVVFAFVPMCVAFALSWGLVGGVYLLTRQATGGKEVEDLFMPIAKPADDLPELPKA